jgi:hypothetical protein
MRKWAQANPGLLSGEHRPHHALPGQAVRQAVRDRPGSRLYRSPYLSTNLPH